MPKDRNAFKLGLTMIAMFGLFIAVLIFIAGRTGGDMQRVVVRFPDGTVLPTLADGSEVHFGPQVVGHVISLGLHEASQSDQFPADASEPAANLAYFELTLEVSRRIGLRTDCRITVASPIIGAIGTVVIQERGTSPTPLADGAVVAGAPPFSISRLGQELIEVASRASHELDARSPDALLALIKEQLNAADERSLLGKIHRSLDDVNLITRRTAGQFDETQRKALLSKLHVILDNVNATTASLSRQLDAERDGVLLAKVHTALDRLNAGLGEVADMIHENRAPVRGTISAVEATARRLDREITTSVAEQLNVDNPISLLAKVHLAVDQINDSLADVKSIVSTGRETVALNVHRIDKTMQNLKEGSDHLRAGLKDLRQNPWKLLYTPTPNETREANIHRAAREFSEAATRLDDAMARLRAFSESRNGAIPGDDEQLVKIRATLSETFRAFTEAERALWRELQIE